MSDLRDERVCIHPELGEARHGVLAILGRWLEGDGQADAPRAHPDGAGAKVDERPTYRVLVVPHELEGWRADGHVESRLK